MTTNRDQAHDTQSAIADLTKQFRDGKLERRQFLSGAVALGLSVAAAIVLATNAMAAERAPSPAERGAPGRGDREYEVEMRIPSDLRISDRELGVIAKDYENSLLTVIRPNNPEAPSAQIRKVKIKTQKVKIK